MKICDYKYMIEVAFAYPDKIESYDIKRLSPFEVQDFCTHLEQNGYQILTLEVLYHHQILTNALYDVEQRSWLSILNNIMISLQRGPVIKRL